MSTLSATDLEKYLREYSVYLDHWVADKGDSHEMLGAREILQKQIALLSKDQEDELANLDKKAVLLVSQYQGSET